MDTVFKSIIEHKDGYIVWEDPEHIAFLTPYPNTPGVTIVVPKRCKKDYVFELGDEEYTKLMLATKTVADLLQKALAVPRVALVFEGTGVAYVHAKLYPLHGKQAAKTDVWGDHREYTEVYKNYITTLEGPKMANEKLKAIQQNILDAQVAN